MSSLNFSSLMDHIWPGITFLHSDAEGALGGIATMWNPNSMTRLEFMKDKNLLITKYQTSNER